MTRKSPSTSSSSPRKGTSPEDGSRILEDVQALCYDGKLQTAGHVMDGPQAIGNRFEADADSPVYVPPLQLTEGQPPPIAANGGLSYMSFDRDGDAGTAAALEAALQQIADGPSRMLIDRLDNAPPGPIETKWGFGFRGYDECVEHIRAIGMEAPEGGVALPLRYTVYAPSVLNDNVTT